MKLLTFIWLSLQVAVLSAQISPFNGLKVPDSTGESYSFLVSGHFHGSSQNTSGYPAASLLANIENINGSEALFICSTGDLFLDVKNDIPQYRQALFSRLGLPLFNAVGNHDISGKIYQENFGRTWFSFKTGNELFIFLDTEMNDGSIKGEQWDFFSQVVEQSCAQQQVKNVFIFSHRPVWAEGNQELKDIFRGNTQSDFGNNFEKQVLPLMKRYMPAVSFYWFSGSLGGNAPASFFYHNPSPGLYYIQSAIRDLPRDGMIRVKVIGSHVSFETISLSGKKMPALEECGLKMWKKKSGAPGFNYRLIPLYVKQMLFHRYFWYGAGCCLLVIVLMHLFRKRTKRKKIV